MTQTTSSEASFVLPIDKPSGPTSHDIVARARRALKTKRVGHTGTLDPFASGLLLLCVGNATRIAEYLTRLPKTYEATLAFGASTDTDDNTGRFLATSDDWTSLGTGAINAAFERWRGTHEQTPSQFSAKKVDGERAYDAARRGEVVDIKPVEITIHDIVVDEIALPSVRFTVSCSSGTYIRALARDIGGALGVGAHLTSLRRTRVGVHDVARAIPLTSLDDAEAVAAVALSPLESMAHMTTVQITAADVVELRHGRVARVPDGIDLDNGDGREQPLALAHDGGLIAIGVADGRWLRPRKVFASA